ncbi:hypothetical protein B0T19DRAFT_287455 [Cercophora scortea]|uniref:Protein kinase domain-containing protein n=1 Tax=Cercophora scortea TaxID=314031 RepID=A0AAE0M447_9PEZI|nr:hypothetical protein B0T19DRAFT_287455 [Cercophora scortea]
MNVPQSPLASDTESDLDSNAPQQEPSQRLRFQLGTRWILAEGTICDHHPNVVHCRVLPNSLLDRVLWLLRFLPTPLRACVQSRWPERILPPNIVLKRQKIDWVDEFDNELAIYRRLAPLQGTVIPVCYGEAKCPATESTGTRALVLSDVGGIGLDEPAAGGLETEHVESMLMESLQALTSLGVVHDDAKLDNYRLVGDRIVVIDFDSSDILQSGDDDVDLYVKSDAKFATRLYWQSYGGKRPKLM